MALFISFLWPGVVLYIAVGVFCILFLKRRSPAQIQERRARQTPIYAALAGVLGGDIATILYSFYIRSPIPVSLLWIMRIFILGVFVKVYGIDALTLDRNGPLLPVVFGYFLAAFTSMYVSAMIARVRARPLSKSVLH